MLAWEPTAQQRQRIGRAAGRGGAPRASPGLACRRSPDHAEVDAAAGRRRSGLWVVSVGTYGHQAGLRGVSRIAVRVQVGAVECLRRPSATPRFILRCRPCSTAPTNESYGPVWPRSRMRAFGRLVTDPGRVDAHHRSAYPLLERETQFVEACPVPGPRSGIGRATPPAVVGLQQGYQGWIVMFVPHAKIAVPELPSEFVDRAALRAYLDAADVGDVTLVCAPAGFGKTSLLADWARTSTDVDTAWVVVDAYDNDPQRLWMAVVAAVASCPSVPPSSRLREPWAWNPADQPTFVAELLDALRTVPTPIRLVLDDVHELINAEALGGLENFIRNRPIGVQLVLSSRVDPPVSLARLRLAGRLGELRVDRLRFSRSETAALLRRSGLRLTPLQVQVLHEKTGGWAACLRLAAFAVANTPDLAGFLADFSDDEHPVADYLVEEILAELPDDAQQLLQATSISESIPTGLAIELTGRDDAGNLLDKFEHETSLVMATGPLREGYRVQPLLRIYLLADLQREGATRVAGLRDTAARWWAGQGQREGDDAQRGGQMRFPAVHSG